jgi:hypothetical protein
MLSVAWDVFTFRNYTGQYVKDPQEGTDKGIYLHEVCLPIQTKGMSFSVSGILRYAGYKNSRDEAEGVRPCVAK